MAKQEFYQVGDIQHDIVGEFFKKVHSKWDGEKHVEVQEFANSNNRLSCLIIDNRMKAFVIERRTEYNDLEFTLGEVSE